MSESGSSLRVRKKLKIREAIVDAALALFDERGFDEVTVADIADRAEVGRSTFFRYFTDKREVLFDDRGEWPEVLAEACGPVARRCAPIGDSVTAALVVARAGLIAYAERIGTDPARFALRQKLVDGHPELRARNLVKEQVYLAAGIDVMVRYGATPGTATLAAHLALACFAAARARTLSAGGQLAAAIDAEFARLASIDVAHLAAALRCGSPEPRNPGDLTVH
jgi:AcrR family transcriptional regulator